MRLLGLLLMSASLGLSVGCAPRARMCVASTECTGDKDVACVAGRCQPDKPSVKPAIDSAKRMVFHPVDLAVIRRGSPSAESEGGFPPSFALGHDGGALLMRFEVSLAPTLTVVEAYVVLRRSDAVDDDSAPLSLHATRIAERWQSRSTSWARAPRLEENRTPSTRVEVSGPSLVRVDVRDLVRRWPRRDAADQGIAIVADQETRTGTTFALSGASGADRFDPMSDSSPAALGGASRPRDIRSSSSPDAEPYLELYVK